MESLVKIIVIIGLLFFLMPSTSNAQLNDSGFQFNGSALLAGSPRRKTPQVYYSNRIKQEFLDKVAADKQIDTADVIGSIYLSGYFKPAIIKDVRLEKKESVYLRYNIYNDVFEVKYEDIQGIFGLLKNQDFSATIGDKYFEYKEIPVDGDMTDGYLELLKKYEDFKIYKRYYQVLRMPRKAKTSLEIDRPARVTTYNSYYVERNGKLEEIDMNKRRVLKSFPRKEKP